MLAWVLMAVVACSGTITDIGEAAGAGDGTTATLTGFLLVESESIRLCEALAESFPPQCANDRISVIGLEIGDYSLMSAGSVSWTEQPVTIAGRIEDGALLVD